MQRWCTPPAGRLAAFALKPANIMVSTSLVFTAAILGAGAARADPSQQDQFLALLEQEQIPPAGAGEIPGVVARAHQICADLNGGTPVAAAIENEIERGYAEQPLLRLYADRVRKTAVRFVTATVDIYCPSHKDELPPYL